MTFKKLVGKLHLWLGLSSGLVVFIIAITGCIYAFQEEIQSMTQPYRYVEPQNKNFLPPSRIREIADKQLPGKHIHAVLYQKKNRTAQAIYFSLEDDYYDIVYINPYHGEVLKVKDAYSDFFSIVLDGHFYLWLPHNIGQPIVASATLIFLVMMLTGLFLWWKRKKGAENQRFKIKWNARWRRKNYDLHNVLGFYITWLAIIFALTGLVWGFEWFAKGIYAATSGGKELIQYYNPSSDTTAIANSDMPAIDKVWLKMVKEYPTAEAIEVHPPEDAYSSIAANANPDVSTYYKIDYRYFDQYTFKELPVNHMWNRIHKLSGADILMRMNYDIHTGAILGLPGKFLAFFASLIVASLPITGFMIWWGRRKKEKRSRLNLKSSDLKLRT
ncbi:MAG: PepSY domain-containing protein [Cytophagaceae bacterium]|nr:PepSY domain-containing protein [Cytophagaceae bacterium]